MTAVQCLPMPVPVMTSDSVFGVTSSSSVDAACRAADDDATSHGNIWSKEMQSVSSDS
jgi:hypothetical protein